MSSPSLERVRLEDEVMGLRSIGHMHNLTTTTTTKPKPKRFGIGYGFSTNYIGVSQMYSSLTFYPIQDHILYHLFN